MFKGEEKSETVKKLLEDNSSLTVVEIDNLSNISTEDKNDGKDYISIMNDIITEYKKELYKK